MTCPAEGVRPCRCWGPGWRTSPVGPPRWSPGVAQEPDVAGDGGLGPAARELQAAEPLVMGTTGLGPCVEDVCACRAALGHRAGHRGGSPR